MRLSECLDLGVFVSAPAERDEPEPMWVAARDAGQIPANLYELYRITNYLSPSGIAGWRTEAARVVSGYFSRTVRSLTECFVEAAELEAEMVRLLATTYTPLKKARGEQWDQNATRRFRSAFRLWLIDVTGIVDSLAELTAMILPGAVPKLQLGQGASGPLLTWVGKELRAKEGVVDPITFYAEALHNALKSHVTLPPEHNWWHFVRVYRNKLAHLGHQAFINFGLQGSDGEFYYFLPRQWPFNPEKHIEVRVPGELPTDDMSAKQHLAEALLMVDTATFIHESNNRMLLAVNDALAELLAAWRQLRIPDAADLSAKIDVATQGLTFRDFPAAG